MSQYSNDAGGQRAARGFSLVEVLVAFVILALVLGVIMRIFSEGMSRVSASDRYARAVILAESKLAQLGAEIPLEEGELSGEDEGALHWRVRLAEYDTGQASAATGAAAAQTAMRVRLLQVDVEISWAESPAAPRSIRLVTLKLARKALL